MQIAIKEKLTYGFKYDMTIWQVSTQPLKSLKISFRWGSFCAKYTKFEYTKMQSSVFYLPFQIAIYHPILSNN